MLSRHPRGLPPEVFARRGLFGAALVLGLFAVSPAWAEDAPPPEESPEPDEAVEEEPEGEAGEAGEARPETEERRERGEARRRRSRRRRPPPDARRRRPPDERRRRRRPPDARRRRPPEDRRGAEGRRRRRPPEDRRGAEGRRRRRPPEDRREEDRREDEAHEEERPDPSEGSRWLVGLRGGFVAIPSGLLRVFVDGGQGKVGGAVGAYAAYQRNTLEISLSLWWADYSYDDEVIFQSAGDRNDPEFVRNDLSLLTIGADFVWTHWFTRWMGALYGAGLGLSVVLGDVRRTEATPPTGPYAAVDETPTNGYVHCRYDPSDPSWTTPFCEPACSDADVAAGTCPPRDRATEGEDADLTGFYDTQEDRIPSVLPWIDLLIGLRFLPHQHFQIDIITGIGWGILFDVRMAYRF